MNIQPGSSIGRYHIQEQLGLGGMATVYKAYDTRLERDVAVKVIRTGAFPPDVLDRILKRFDREAKSLARLNHPNIVGIIDYGEQDGTPYLVMPFYPAGTLKQSLGKPMPPAEAARLLAPVARALAYAHQQGILHRDVKPSNILITGSGEPVLTDFGIAKLLEDDGGATLTGTGVGVGTPEYMAPEQGMGREIDGRADVYALGVVLYELVTGRKPYTADTPMAVIFKHLTDPLPRPKEAVANLPDVVEQVILKALAKKPEDRYQNMGDFAAALAKIDVQPRESAAAVAESQSPSARQAPDLYDVYEDETGEATMDMGETPPAVGNAERIQNAAVSPAPQSSPDPAGIPSQQVPHSLSEVYADETGEETSDFYTGIASTPQMAKPVVTNIVNPASSSPEKQDKVESQSSTGEVQELRVENHPEVSRTPGKKDALAQTKTAKKPWPKWALAAIGVVIIGAIVWVLDSSKEPSATSKEVPTQEAAIILPTPVPSSEVLSDSNGNLMRRLENGSFSQLVFSADGKNIAAATSLGIFLYDAETLELIHFFDTGWWNDYVAISPDGSRLASGANDNTIPLWDVKSGALLQSFTETSYQIKTVAFSPDGRWLAAGGWDKTIKLYDMESGLLLQILEGHTDGVESVAFSPDGKWLASGAYDNTIRLWDVKSGALLQTLNGHNMGVLCVTFSPDGSRLASGSWDKTIKLWDAESGALLQTLEGHKNAVNSVAFSPDGSVLASGSNDDIIRLWDSESGAWMQNLEGHTGDVLSVAFSPDGRQLASGSKDGTIRIWDISEE